MRESGPRSSKAPCLFPLLLFGAVIDLLGLRSAHICPPRSTDKPPYKGPFCVHTLTFCCVSCSFEVVRLYQFKRTVWPRYRAPVPAKTLNIWLLCCLSLAPFNGLTAVASSPTVHAVCLCDSLHTDDLLVGALWRSISSFLGLFS